MADLKELLEGASSEVLKNLKEVTETYISLEGIIPAVTELFSDQAGEIRLYNKELGTGSKTSSAFRGELAKIAKQTGINIKEQIELVSVTKQYHQGIQDTTKATLNFVRASGVSVNTIGELSATMTIMGNTSEEAFRTMYEGILSVRDALGLTADQIDITAAILTKYNVITQASEQRMIASGKSVAKFVSILTSAGVKGDEVSEILDKLIDPDKLTDNIALLSKMGLTVSDLVAGDPLEKLDGAAEKLRDIGQQISDIAKTNRFQANALAKVYGLTLEQAVQLSKIDTSDVSINTQKSLEDYRNEVATLVQTLSDFNTMIGGTVVETFSWVGNIIEKFTNAIGVLPRALTSIVTVLIGKKLFEKISGFFGSAAKKFGRNFGEGFGDYLRQVELRDKAKVADMAGLTPKDSKQRQDYGWGYNYYLEQVKRGIELDRSRNLRNGSLEPGEYIEIAQGIAKEARPILEQYKAAPKFEKAVIEKLYPWINNQNSAIFKLINKVDTWESKDALSNDYLSQVAHLNSLESSKYSDPKKIDKASKEIINTFSGITKDKLGDSSALDLLGTVADSKRRNQIAKVMAEHKDEGFLKTLQALETFFESCGGKEGSDTAIALEKVRDAIKNLKDTANGEIGPEFKESVENANRALGQNGNLTNRFGTLLKGFGLSIGNFFKSGLTRVIRFGVAGAIGGVLSLMAKSEKFQEAMTNFTENVVTPIIEFITPAFEWVAGVVADFVNWLSRTFGPTLTKLTSNINKSVSSIESSYKQEDLKTMMLASGVEYRKDEDRLVAVMGEAIYEIKNISKKQDVANDNRIAAYAT